MIHLSKTFVIFICALGLSFLAQATITNVSVSKTFYNFTLDATITTPTIYAGRAGTVANLSNCPATPSEDGCDSCQFITNLSSPADCNTNSIVPSTLLAINFTSDKADAFTTGTKIFMTKGTVPISAQASTVTLAAGTPITARFSWAHICELISGTTDCETTPTGSQTVTIGLSKDGTSTTFQDSFTMNIYFRRAPESASFHKKCDAASSPEVPSTGDGVCAFTVKSGDEKVFLSNVVIPVTDAGATGSWPSTGDASGVNYSGIKVYYRVADNQSEDLTTLPSTEWVNIAPNATGVAVADLTISPTGGIAKSRITGLANDVNYVFAIATVDQAGNQTQFSSVTDSSFAQSIHAGRPGEVVGLLTDQSCFIATAAYGSEMEPQVQALRTFRDSILLKNKFGAWLVKSYYRMSPPMAEFIAEHDSLRAIVRALLKPVIGWAQFTTKHGAAAGLSILILMGLLGWQIVRRARLLRFS